MWECEPGTQEDSTLFARKNSGEKAEMGDGNKEDGEDKDRINSKNRRGKLK